MATERETFGDVVRFVVGERTLREVGGVADISHTYISDWLGDKRPTLRTLLKAADAWEAKGWLRGDLRVRLSSLDQYRRVIEVDLVPRLGAVPVGKLTPLHLADYYTQRTKEGIGASTLKTHSAILRQALGQAVEWGMIRENPALRASSPPKGSPRTDRAVSADRAGEILTAAEGTWLYLPVLIAMLLGIRRGEVVALRWSDWDEVAGRLTVQRTLYFPKGAVPTYQPRKGGQPVTLPVGLDLAGELRKHREAQEARKETLGPSWHERGLILPTPDGTERRPDYLTQAFRLFLAAHGLPPMRFHDLRHSSAAIALRAGVPLNVVSERLGHSSRNITLLHYGHLLPGQQEDATERLEAALRAVRDGKSAG